MRPIAHPWTADRDQVLTDLWQKGETGKAVAALKVSANACRARASMLGLVTPATLRLRENIKLVHEGIRRCVRCGEIKPLDDFYSLRRNAGYATVCKACNSAGRHASIRTKLAHTEAARHIPIERLIAMYERQKGRCFYSGVQMEWGCRSELGCTVDRIDSAAGYSEANVVLCCYRMNMMKHVQSADAFIDWCSKVAAHRKSSKN